MKSLITFALFLALSGACCFAQFTADPVSYNFGGPLVGYPELSVPGSPYMEGAVNYSSGGGKFWQGKLRGPEPAPKDFIGQPHYIKFITGPLVSQTADHIQFAPGGHFHMLAGTMHFLFCGTVETNMACRYDAHWVGNGPAFDIIHLFDGACIVRFSGELEGSYFDEVDKNPDGTPIKHVRAYYDQPSIKSWSACTFSPTGPQSWGIGTLQVVLVPFP